MSNVQLKSELLAIYPNYELPILEGVTHSDIRDNRFTDEELTNIVRILEMPEVNDSAYAQLLEVLKGIGVEQLPTIPVFNNTYHAENDCTPGQPVDTIHHGWMRDGRVLIKSTIEASNAKKEL